MRSVIDGKPKIIPFKFFAEKATQIKERIFEKSQKC